MFLNQTSDAVIFIPFFLGAGFEPQLVGSRDRQGQTTHKKFTRVCEYPNNLNAHIAFLFTDLYLIVQKFMLCFFRFFSEAKFLDV